MNIELPRKKGAAMRRVQTAVGRGIYGVEETVNTSKLPPKKSL